METRPGLRQEYSTPPVTAKRWRTAVIGSEEGPWTYSHYSYKLPSRDDECLSTCTTPCASTINCTRVVFYREGLLVGIVPCLRSLSAVVALPYRHNLTKRLWTPIPSVSWESWWLFQLTVFNFCTDWKYSLITTFNIIIPASAESASE